MVKQCLPCSLKTVIASCGRAQIRYAQLERPDVFDAYFCFSPAFWRDNHAVVTEAEEAWAATDNLPVFLYLSLGTEENDKMRKGYEAITDLLERKPVPGLVVLQVYTPGADHGSNTYLLAPGALSAWASNTLAKHNISIKDE